MRNKGFFWFLTIVLSAVCVYQLSFTWVSSSVEEKAEKEAAIRVSELESEAKKNNGEAVLPNGTTINFSDPESYELAKAAYINLILKEKADDKVYPVLGSNFQEVKNKSLAFGLDLVGGMSVTLEVSVPELVKSLARNPRDLRFKKPYESALRVHMSKGGDFISLFASEFKKFNGSEALIVSELAITEIEELNKNTSNSDVISYLKNKITSSIDGVEQIMTKRINQFGVAQPNITKDSRTNRIYIELPGVQDETTVAKKLQSTANLQFYETYEKNQIQPFLSQANILSTQKELVVEAIDTTLQDSTALAKKDSLKKTTSKPLTFGSKENSLETYLNGGDGPVIGTCKVEDKEKVDKILRRNDIKAVFPIDMAFMWSSKPEKYGNTKEEKYVLNAVKIPEGGKALVGGKDVSNANKGLDQASGAVTVDLKMTVEGGEKWAQMTQNNVGRCVAITMDSVVYSAPRVNEAITQGNTQISGSFSIQDAEDLAGLLNGGALPTPCVIKELTKVGPSIGSENSQAGLISFAFAFLAVLIYMWMYYGKGGMVANIALAVNVVFILGCLASFGAVLTLAGIAGIVLTIGTAVDANILIFERIREEIKAGVGNTEAINIGFKKALPSIIDANVTHLLVGIILKVFGKGEMESFATTLIIGIFTSLFTAIVISRLVITYMLEKGKSISFSTNFLKNAFQNFNIDWVGKRKYYYIFSITVTLLGVFSLFSRGLKQSVEFTGGRTYSVKFEQRADIELIRKNLEKVFVENGEVSSIDLKTKSSEYYVEINTNYKLTNDNANKEVTGKLVEGLNACKEKLGKFEIKEQRSVSASISNELWTSSAIAILISLIVIFAYIRLRFENWQYSLGAIIGLAHDAFFVVSIFSLLHGYLPFSLDVNQAFIAAILTVMSYSMNDTVIVFDRIRENLRAKKEGENREDIINKSLNTTLSRTFNTSMILFLVILIMFIFGGPAIKGFLFAMLIGVVIGTYSSICIATPLLIDLNKKGKK